MSQTNIEEWIYIRNSVSLDTLIKDFSIVPQARPSILPILTKAIQTSFGDFIEYKGVKTPYLGAFTRREEEFLKSIYAQFNGKIKLKVMKFIHTTDENGLVNGADIHLFSGSSKLGTYRVDINPKSKATHIIT